MLIEERERESEDTQPSLPPSLIMLSPSLSLYIQTIKSIVSCGDRSPSCLNKNERSLATRDVDQKIQRARSRLSTRELKIGDDDDDSDGDNQGEEVRTNNGWWFGGRGGEPVCSLIATTSTTGIVYPL